MTLTDTEKAIILFLRQANPLEEVRIIKDRLGKPDKYLIYRNSGLEINQLSVNVMIKQGVLDLTKL